ncbi:hypothetical protein GQ607_004235 [Colletotrichum asianum]|uniref:Uncharacterized protein n=1 Tax=Colletotrichum asianum TaxID=702518 RepID=A0A8H3WJP9_9PEZI|nr:hypothetical protein GQ607_004235 [Colletotrichum asianum]
MAARFVSTLWAGRRKAAGLPISQTRRRGRGNRAPKRVSTGLALGWHRHHQLQSPTDGLPEIARSKPSSPATGLETDGFPPDTTYRYQEVIARIPEGPQKSTRAIRWRARKEDGQASQPIDLQIGIIALSRRPILVRNLNELHRRNSSV